MNPEIESLKQAMEALKARCEQSERHSERMLTEYRSLRCEYRQAGRRLRAQAAAVCSVLIGIVLISPGNRTAFAQSVGTLQQLAVRVTALEVKTKYMTVSTDADGHAATLFSACNVYINNGLGATDGNPNDPNNVNHDAVVNGLGNLIIGYNEEFDGTSNTVPQFTTGSHNLIVGMGHSYDSFGGIVAGQANILSAPYASVLGGFLNMASGVCSAVSGGEDNRAAGACSAVSGGKSITQKYPDGWSGGGYHNP